MTVRDPVAVRRRRSVEQLNLAGLNDSEPVFLCPDGSYVAGAGADRLLDHVARIGTVGEVRAVQLFLERELAALAVLRRGQPLDEEPHG